jgi:hypothetical protein
MEWGRREVDQLNVVFRKKFLEMKISHNTDRANFSAIWNRYLGNYGASVFSKEKLRGGALDGWRLFSKLIDIVNFDNERVSGCLVLENPDRAGQYILIRRDVAERIMVLGML